MKPYPHFSAGFRRSGPPVNTVLPVISGTVGIGNSPTVTPGTWTGIPSLTYTLLRDGVPVAGVTLVSAATFNAYTFVDLDIGPELDVLEHDSVGNTDVVSATPIIWDDVTRAPNTAIWISDEGRTDVSGGVDVWASTYGGKACTLTSFSASQRPAVNLTGGVGGRVLITADGTDDGMTGTLTLGANHTQNEYAFTGYRVAFSTLGDVCVGYSVGGGLRYALRDRTAAVFYNGAGTSSIIAAGAGADPDSNNQRWWALRDSATTTASLGHGTTTDASSAGATVVSYADGGSCTFASSDTGTVNTNIAVQAIDFGQLMTATERAEVRAFITYKTGIAA